MGVRVLPTSIFAGICAAVVFSIRLAAQEGVVSYAGELRGGGSCPLNGAATQITVQGDDIKGTRALSTGSPTRFEGKLQGSKFIIITKDSRGNQTGIKGTVEAEKVDLRLEQGRCSYYAVLKKVTG